MIERFAGWFWARFGPLRQRRCGYCRTPIPSGHVCDSPRCQAADLEMQEMGF